MRKTITVGRVKGSMIYTGVNPESIQNPLDNDLYFHTQEYKFYCYNDGSWNEVSDLREYVINTLNKDLEEKKVLENINELQQETIDINNRIDQVEQTKADLSYVKTQDDEIKRVKADVDYVDNELLMLIEDVADLYSTKADLSYVKTQDDEIKRVKADVDYVDNEISILIDDVADLYSTKADTQYVNEKFNQILGEGATETLDTIAEISKALEEHNDEYDSLLAVVGNKADKNEVPTKLSDLKIDIEVGGVDEEEVMEIVEENGEEVEDIELLEIEDIDLSEVQAEYSIGTSSNYDATNDNQIVTTKAVKSIVDAVANVLQVNIDDKADKTSIPTALSQLNNDSNFITKTVNDLQNYYKKTEVNDLISTIPTMNLLVVSTLPTTNISTSTIYLVPYGNEYEEFIYINSAWEMLGTTKINISDYATKEYVDSKIESSITSALEGDY